MIILIGQPVQEKNTGQLEREIRDNPGIDMIIYPEGYLADEEALESACVIAKKYGKTIITGYKSNNKHRAVIIGQSGNKILDRPKTPKGEELYGPLVVDYCGLKIGYLLCREVLKGLAALEGVRENVDFIAHPIGVGMFSEEQFDEWINAAKSIAVAKNTIIIGTSHADGVLTGYDVSIPIAYCIDNTGKALYISKSDLRSRTVDLYTKKVRTI